MKFHVITFECLYMQIHAPCIKSEGTIKKGSCSGDMTIIVN